LLYLCIAFGESVWLLSILSMTYINMYESVANEVKYLEYPKGLHEIVAEAEHLEADRCICKVKKRIL